MNNQIQGTEVNFGLNPGSKLSGFLLGGELMITMQFWLVPRMVYGCAFLNPHKWMVSWGRPDTLTVARLQLVQEPQGPGPSGRSSAGGDANVANAGVQVISLLTDHLQQVGGSQKGFRTPVWLVFKGKHKQTQTKHGVPKFLETWSKTPCA